MVTVVNVNLDDADARQTDLTVKVLLAIYVLSAFFQLQENQDEIENMMNAIFKGVFVHRYR